MQQLTQWYYSQPLTDQWWITFAALWVIATVITGVVSFVVWRFSREKTLDAGAKPHFFMKLPSIGCPLPTDSPEKIREKYKAWDNRYKPKTMSERHAERKAREEETVDTETQISVAIDGFRKWGLPSTAEHGIPMPDAVPPKDVRHPADWREHVKVPCGFAGFTITDKDGNPLPEGHEFEDDDVLEINAKATDGMWLWGPASRMEPTCRLDITALAEPPTLREAAESVWEYFDKRGISCHGGAILAGKLAKLRAALDAEEPLSGTEHREKIFETKVAEGDIVEVYLMKFSDQNVYNLRVNGRLYAVIDAPDDEEDEEEPWSVEAMTEALEKMRSNQVMVLPSNPSPVEQMAQKMYIQTQTNGVFIMSNEQAKERSYKAARAFYGITEEGSPMEQTGD